MKTYTELVLDSFEVEKDFIVETATAFFATYQPTIILATKIGASILGAFGATAGVGYGIASFVKHRQVQNVYKILQKEYNLSKEELAEIKKKIDKQVRQCVLKENVSPEECAKKITILKSKKLKELFKRLSEKFSGKTKNIAAAIATALGVALVTFLGRKYLKIDAPVYSLKFWKALVEYLKNPNGSKKVKALLLVSAGLALVGLAILGYSGAKLLLKKVNQLLKKEG